VTAVVIPTRRPLLSRVKALAREVYIRWRIRCAEEDLAQHVAELEHAVAHLPDQIDLCRQHIDALRRRLEREVT
jgi:hypothetical protein